MSSLFCIEGQKKFYKIASDSSVSPQNIIALALLNFSNSLFWNYIKIL